MEGERSPSILRRPGAPHDISIDAHIILQRPFISSGKKSWEPFCLAVFILSGEVEGPVVRGTSCWFSKMRLHFATLLSLAQHWTGTLASWRQMARVCLVPLYKGICPWERSGIQKLPEGARESEEELYFH